MLARLTHLVKATFRHAAGGRGTPPVTSGTFDRHDWHAHHKRNRRIAAARQHRAHQRHGR